MCVQPQGKAARQLQEASKCPNLPAFYPSPSSLILPVWHVRVMEASEIWCSPQKPVGFIWRLAMAEHRGVVLWSRACAHIKSTRCLVEVTSNDRRCRTWTVLLTSHCCLPRGQEVRYYYITTHNFIQLNKETSNLPCFWYWSSSLKKGYCHNRCPGVPAFSASAVLYIATWDVFHKEGVDRNQCWQSSPNSDQMLYLPIFNHTVIIMLRYCGNNKSRNVGTKRSNTLSLNVMGFAHRKESEKTLKCESQMTENMIFWNVYVVPFL